MQALTKKQLEFLFSQRVYSDDTVITVDQIKDLFVKFGDKYQPSAAGPQKIAINNYWKGMTEFYDA